MSTKPILFSTPMVQAILAGRKIMTRRVMKPQPVLDDNGMWCWKDCQWMDGGLGFPDSGIDDHAPYQRGQVMWVRETWCPCATINGWLDDVSLYGYKADYDRVVPWKWKPSIHMPRAAARIFLRVTDVRAERVQDITHAGVLAEGVPQCPGWKFEISECDCTTVTFINLWNSLNAKRGFDWYSNPWVWVYSFERVDKPAGWPGGDKGAEQ